MYLTWFCLLPFVGYFDNQILFLTVSQSPNVELLKSQISEYIREKEMSHSSHGPIRRRKSQSERRIGARTLVVLDDIWSVSVLEQLISRISGCKTLVVSRFKFPTVINLTYELELLREDEAISLFCQVVFGQKSTPLAANKNLVKQVFLCSVGWCFFEFHKLIYFISMPFLTKIAFHRLSVSVKGFLWPLK